MGPLPTDPRVELVLRVLDAIHVRPTRTEVEAAARTIVHLLDDDHAHDGRTALNWDDDTD